MLLLHFEFGHVASFENVAHFAFIAALSRQISLIGIFACILCGVSMEKNYSAAPWVT